MREYHIPEFKSIFPVKENPYFNNDLISNWIEELNLSSNFGVEHLKTINNFIFDDHTECSYGDINRNETLNNAVWNQIIEVLDNVKSKQFNNDWKPYVKLFYRTVERVFQNVKMPMESKDRFIKFYKEYCEGTIDETRYCNHEFNDFDQLFNIKVKSMAVKSVIGLIEIAYDLYLTDQEWNDSDFKNILNLTIYQIIYVNDLYSFEKEFKEQNKILTRTPNIIAQKLLNVKNETLFKKSVETIYNNIIIDIKYYERELSNAIQEFLNDNGKTMNQKSYVEKLVYVVSGNYFTSLTNIRYN